MFPQDDNPLTAPRRSWWHLATVDTRPLRRHRDFRLLFIGRFVSFFGTMITVVAFPYHVYQLTHSVLLVGVLDLIEFGPILTFAFLGGALADAWDRRSMVLATEVAMMACSLILARNAALPHPQLWLLLGVAPIWGCWVRCSARRLTRCFQGSSTKTSWPRPERWEESEARWG